MTNHFVEISREKFKFLENKYGSLIEVISDGELIWCFNGYSLRIVYDNKRSYELDVLLKKDGDSSSFSLRKLARYAGVTLENNIWFQASTEERMETIVTKMADILSRVCDRIPLFASETIYNLQQQRSRECLAYAKRLELEMVRLEAEKAWHERDYVAIKALYEPFLNDLLKSEIRKYEYALRQLNTLKYSENENH